MRLEFAIDIHRPLRDVFAVVGNLENDPKWQAAVISASKITPGPIAEGARFRHVVNIMGSWSRERFDRWRMPARRTYVKRQVRSGCKKNRANDDHRFSPHTPRQHRGVM